MAKQGKITYGSKKRRRVVPKKTKFTYKEPAMSTHKAVSFEKGMGTALYANLIYSEKDVQIGGGAGGTTSSYVFRADLYDPNFTGAGRQPSGFDQLMALYEKYCVYECSYKVTFVSTSTSNTTIVGVSIADDNSTTSDLNSYVENGVTEYHALPGTNSIGAREITGTFDVAKMHGISRQKLFSDDTFWGTSSTAANDCIFLKCWVSDPYTDATQNVQIVAEVRMKARFMGTKQVGQS